jgi:N-acetylneuraminate lyase
MDPTGPLDLALIERQAEFLMADEVGGVFVAGTTGEGPSLSTAERMRLAERWKQVAGGDFPVFVHVGHASLPDAKALALHAQSIGAAGTAAIAPYFFKGLSADALLDWCAEVAAAASGLPFFYYHFPAMSGVDVLIAPFMEAAIRRIPNLAGFKFTDADLFDFSRLVQLGGLEALFGRDEMLLPALTLGATAALGGTYNFTGPIFRRLWDAFDRGDLAAARAEQETAQKIIAVLQPRGVAAIKAVMPLIGLDLGPPRLPLAAFTPSEMDALGEALDAAGLFAARRQAT